jgi:hypothetical protein
MVVDPWWAPDGLGGESREVGASRFALRLC